MMKDWCQVVAWYHTTPYGVAQEYSVMQLWLALLVGVPLL